ncbi:hypothetical protein GCM10027594_07300 [Hymenobacter agri]
MKKGFYYSLLAVALLTGRAAQAQITPEKVYNGGGYMVRLSNGDYKYVMSDASNQHTLYNLNHSIFKQFTPPVLSNATPAGVAFISDRLFDTNPSTIEYLAFYYNPTNGNAIRATIFSETGTTLAVLDSTYDADIYNTPAGTKLLAQKSGYNATGGLTRFYTRVYSLPGQLALRAATAGVAEQVDGAYPNPAHEKVTLPYAVPAGQVGTLQVMDLSGKLVARYQVDSHVKALEMSARDLHPGLYVYSVTTPAGTTAGRRFVIQ